MKIAKRYILLLLVFVVSLSLCSCSSSTVVISQGLENYTGVESNYGLCPGEALNTLMAEFDYVNGDFYYYDKSNIGGSIEEYTIAYFTYTEHIYDQVMVPWHIVSQTRSKFLKAAARFFGFPFRYAPLQTEKSQEKTKHRRLFLRYQLFLCRIV